MTVAGSSAPAAASSSSASRRQAGRSNRNNNNNNNNMNNNADADMTASADTGFSQAHAGEGAAQVKNIEFPRAIAQNLKPAIGAFVPHNDSLAKGLQYITEATVEYEEFYGNPNFKGAGAKDSTIPLKKAPSSRAKAVQAAHADQMAFSNDPRIHAMEDALLSVKEMQYQMEAEKQALERLTSIVAAGADLPVANSLEDSYKNILEKEIKHIQARRKQEAIATVGMNSDLQTFRTKVWEVHHDASGLPTSAYGGGVGGEDEDDEDMEIVVTGDGNNVQSLKCPLTTDFLEDPVTSSVCKHSFSSAAIRAMIQARPRAVCPVHGCNRPIALEYLQPNKALARKVARQKMLQQEMSQRPEEEYTTVD
ncbi:MAG: zinc-finger of the MIZ type in Nse subunit-domain-containing protein [Linnemannia gamsii]|nr:MAG: zinc-finger of the MIZ type in Nse subunit-domain-containing protein [Linnemannia gamsii]